MVSRMPTSRSNHDDVASDDAHQHDAGRTPASRVGRGKCCVSDWWAEVSPEQITQWRYATQHV